MMGVWKGRLEVQPWEIFRDLGVGRMTLGRFIGGGAAEPRGPTRSLVLPATLGRCLGKASQAGSKGVDTNPNMKVSPEVFGLMKSHRKQAERPKKPHVSELPGVSET